MQSTIRIPWRWVALAVYIGLNVVLLLYTVPAVPVPDDWRLWSRMPSAIAEGSIYLREGGLPFVWSPLMAPVMAVVVAVGFWPWALAHVAVIGLLRDWRLIALVLLSAGFWTDVASANTFTFIFVAGVLAIRGNRWASIAYLALFLLMPRPVQLPLAAWIVWKMPELRWPAFALFAIHLAAVLITGYAQEWLLAMVLYGYSPAWNVGPTAIFGMGWFLVGAPLAGALTLAGRVGWAGLAITPYLIPIYLLMALLPSTRSRDVVDNRRASVVAALVQDRDAHGVDGERDRRRGGVPPELHPVLAEPHRQGRADPT